MRMASRNVLAVILGGGVGQRLYPLTKNRAKPAVPLGGKYRLIQKLRIHEDDSSAYYEIGQQYADGDNIPLYINRVDADSKSNVHLAVTLNVKTYTTTMNVTAKGEDFSLKLNLASKPSGEKVEVTVPTNPIMFEDVLNALGQQSTPTLQQSDVSWEQQQAE